MQYRTLIGTVLLSVLERQGSLGQGSAHVKFIYMGTPTNGAGEMSGWRGVIVRVMLDSGEPIRRIDFRGGYIGGNIGQRWTDPTGQGNYTETSPGPMTANNTFPSDFNFDSHFLGPAGMYSAAAAGELNAHEFLTSRTGLP